MSAFNGGVGFTSNHSIYSYTSSAADSVINNSDFLAGTTLQQSGVAGSNNLNVTSLITSILNGNPTTTGGSVGFRWIGDPGSGSTITSATLTVNYTQPNTPPTAALAGIAPYSAGTLTQALNGGGSFDPDGTISNYAFTIPTKPTVSGPSATPNVHISNSGLTSVSSTNAVTLVVTDNLGANSSPSAPQSFSYTNARPNAVIALVGGNFDSTMSSRTVNGNSSSDPDAVAVNGFIPNFDNIVSYTWSHTGTNAVSVPLTFAQAYAAGMRENASGNITLNVTDTGGLNDLTPGTLSAVYTAANAVSNSTSNTAIGPNTQFTGTATDADLAVNGSFANFAAVTWEFDTSAAATAGQIGTGVLPGAFANLTGTYNGSSSTFNINQLVSTAALFGLLGQGTHTIFFNVTDSRGTVTSNTLSTLSFAIPEPATIAIWSAIGLMGLAYGAHVRRKRK